MPVGLRNLRCTVEPLKFISLEMNFHGTGIRKFTYTESGGLISANNHWSLDIMKEFPYCEESGPWIVYNCSPEETRSQFSKILSSESLHIHSWDTWSVVG